MKFRVVKIGNRYSDINIEEEILAEVDASLESYKLISEDEIIRVTKNADAIIADLSEISSKVIRNLKKCKVISKVGIGVDNIDLKEATKKGIFVCNVPDYCINEVSDHTIALILTWSRKIVLMNSMVKKGIWDMNKAKPIKSTDKSTLGLVGFGSISRMVALKSKVLNFNIIVFDPFIKRKDVEKYEIKLVKFDYLLKKSDIISIHCPSNEQTHHMFGDKQFKSMKSSSFLINTSRGPIVNSGSLYRALKKNIISGAAVDVYDPEPIHDKDPILKLENFIITPHYGFYSESSLKKVRTQSALNVVKVLSEEEPINVVNKEIYNRQM